ncbi:MAG: hypothetical protein KatS3mg017_0775 [Fimbriimonadales bacterium]|nr:MAG: hypothetical protein KatS3mg017_0775 [Fimbriimonadales bacterium]
MLRGLDSPVQAFPLQGQDCPCYEMPRGLDSPVQAFPLQGQDCPCYEMLRGLDSPVQALPPAGTGLSLLRDFSNTLKKACKTRSQ